MTAECRWSAVGSALLLALPLLLAGCAHNLGALHDSPRSDAVATSATWSSMVYAARTDSGVVVVDLGWFGAERPLRGIITRLGARPEDVSHVFVTHSHRDHVGAWRAVRGARFHVPEAEVPYLLGEAGHRDLPSRVARALFGRGTPQRGEIEVRPFSRDTAFVLGGDTLRAFVVPGHTPGHAAYLFRGVLFVGDAVRRSPVRGWGGAARIFTRDRAQARASLVSLYARALPHGVRWVCNAHAKCARPTPRFLAKTTR